MWQEGAEEEHHAREALEHAAARKREAIALLRIEKKYSANDTARVLGVTRQRVYQLAR
jgi:DNA-directed RNA polymerase specialized sigma24 family protein